MTKTTLRSTDSTIEALYKLKVKLLTDNVDESDNSIIQACIRFAEAHYSLHVSPNVKEFVKSV